MSLAYKIAGNTLVQLVGKLITAGISFSITLIIARSYGAVGYGDFTKIIAYVSLFYLIVDFGLNAVWLKEVNSNISFNSLLITRLVWACVLVVIALIILSLLPYDSSSGQGFNITMKIGVILLFPTIITQAVFVSYNALFQKALRYDRSVIASVLGSVTTLALVILTGVANVPLPILVASYTMGGVVLVASANILSKQFIHWKKSSTKNYISQAKRLMFLSLPLGTAFIFSLIHFKADIIILTIYRTTAEVGIYGLATKLFEFPLVIPIFFMNAIYPIMINPKSKTQNPKLRTKALYFLLIAGIVIGVAGVIVAPLITYIKDEFVTSIIPFRMLMLFMPLFFVSAFYMWALIADGKRWVLVWIYGAGMIVNIGLNIIFIPQQGAIAAAVTTGLSEALILLLLIVNYSRSKQVVVREGI